MDNVGTYFGPVGCDGRKGGAELKSLEVLGFLGVRGEKSQEDG